MHILDELKNAVQGVASSVSDKINELADWGEQFIHPGEPTEGQKKENKLLDQLLDESQKNKGFWNDLNNYLAWGAKNIGLTDWAKSVATENIAEDFEEANKKLPEAFKKNNISVYDIIKYKEGKLTDENLKKKIEGLSSVYDLDLLIPYKEPTKILKQLGYKGDIDFLLDRSKKKDKYRSIITKGFIGNQLSDLADLGVISKSEAEKIVNLMNDYSNKVFELKKSILESYGDKTPKFLKEDLDQLDRDLNTYFTNVVEKIKEYKGDLDKVSNDELLNQLATDIRDKIENLRLKAETVGITLNDSQIGKLKSTFQLGMGLLDKAIDKAQEGYAGLINKIPGVNVEWGNTLQERIDLADDKISTYRKIFEGLGNIVSDLIPAVGSTILGLKGIDKLGKVETIAPRLQNWTKYLLGNEAINGIFNHYFDPALTKNTMYTDMIFDIAGASIMEPAVEGLLKAGKKVLGLTEKDAIKKYLDDVTIEIPTNKQGETKKVKLSEFFRNIDDITDLSKAKAVSDYKAIKDIFDKYIKKLEELDKKKSGLFSPLVKEAKVQVLKDLNSYVKKVNPTLGKFIDTVIKSGNAKAIDAVFSKVKEINQEWDRTVSEFLEKAKNFDDINNFIAGLSLKDSFMKKVANDLTVKNGQIIKVADTNPIPKDYEFKLKLSLKEGKLDDEAFSKVMADAVHGFLKKYKGRRVPYSEVADYFATYFRNILGTTQLPKTYQQYIKNIAQKIEAGKYDKIISKTKISLKPTKYAGKTDNTKDLIELSTIQELYKNNPEAFFIVLFHELTHRKGLDFFKKVVGKKLYKGFEKLYENIVVGLKNFLKIATPEQKQQIEKLLNTVFKDKEEFLAYMIGEHLIRGGNDILDRFVKDLQDMGVEISKKDIDKVKQALQTYIDKRFIDGGSETDINSKISFFAYLGKAIEQGSQKIKQLFLDFMKYRGTGQLSDLIDNMSEQEFKDFVKNVFNEKYYKYLKDLGIPEDKIRDIVKTQIKMNIAGETGLKAAIVWDYLSDLIEKIIKKEPVGEVPEYVKKFVDKNTLNRIVDITNKYIHNPNQAIKELTKLVKDNKIGKGVQVALENIFTSLKDGKADTATLNLVGYLFGKLVGDIGQIRKSSENLISKALAYSYSKLSLVEKHNILKTILNPIGYDIDPKYIRQFKKSGFNIEKGLQEGYIKKTNTKPNDEILMKYISANYYRFNPDIAKNLNKGIINQITDETIKKEAEKLDKQLYKQKQEAIRIAKMNGIEYGIRKYPGIEDKYLAPMLDLTGNRLSFYTETGDKYIYDLKKGELIKETTPVSDVFKQAYNNSREIKLIDNIDFITNKDILKKVEDFVKVAFNC